MKRYYLIKSTGSLLTVRTRGGKIRMTTPNQVQLMYDKNSMPYFIFNKDITRRNKIGAVIVNTVGVAILVGGMLLLLNSYLNDSSGYYTESNGDDTHYEWIDETK